MTSSQHDGDVAYATERDPLLEQPKATDASQLPQGSVPALIARRLYVSHFLSTWNSRVFEFGAVLYLATIFPGTLLPVSLYAATRGLSAIVFAPAVGQYIDSANRLQVVRLSIGKSSVLCKVLSTDYIA
jgi:solute carrier family 40 (iron-regulated transporter), member 1